MAKKNLEGKLNKSNPKVPTRNHIIVELKKHKTKAKEPEIITFCDDVDCPQNDKDMIIDDLKSYPDYYA